MCYEDIERIIEDWNIRGQKYIMKHSNPLDLEDKNLQKIIHNNKQYNKNKLIQYIKIIYWSDNLENFEDNLKSIIDDNCRIINEEYNGFKLI